jgi:hypothetical protein
MGDRRRAYRDMVGKPDGKRPIGIPRARWEDNINMDPQEAERRACTGLIWLRTGTGGGLL